jgi:transcription antitermination factor NusG
MTKGAVVSIKFGPFAGLSGVVIATSPERSTVRILLKGRAVLVELDTDMIRVPVRHGIQQRQRTRPV